MTWTNDELDAIGIAEELNLASVRRDGTLRRPVTMWVVRDGDDVYVRSVNGRRSPWFRGARTRHEAHVRAGGVERDVELVESDERTEAVDAAYREKYGRRYPPIVPPDRRPGGARCDARADPPLGGHAMQHRRRRRRADARRPRRDRGRTGGSAARAARTALSA